MTGAAGFIASHVVKRLLEKVYHVCGTYRLTEDTSHLVKLAERLPGELKVVQAVSMVAASLQTTLSGCSVVLQLANILVVGGERPAG